MLIKKSFTIFLIFLAQLLFCQNSPQTVSYTIPSLYNDAFEGSNGSMNNSKAYSYLGGNEYTKYSAYRFEGINLPANVEILDVKLTFTGYLGTCGDQVKIRQAKSDGGSYTTSSHNISTRNYTSNYVNWSIPTSTHKQLLTTPNLKPLFDEVLASNNANSIHAISFSIEANGLSRCARVGNYELGSSYRPKLDITYKIKDPEPINPITDINQMNLIRINEVSSQGTSEQQDDWIELYNGHDRPVHITGGLFISDKPNNPTLNEITDLVIPAKGFAILIADGDSQGDYQLSFGLSASGEKLALSRNLNGNITELDKMEFGELITGQTFGRYPDGSTNVVKFTTPTYKRSNQYGQQELLVNFSKLRGVYDSGFNLTITGPVGSTIRYTLDGSKPSSSKGTIYSGPININQTKTVRAIAYMANGSSEISTHTYVLKNNYSNEQYTGKGEWLYKNSISASEYADAISDAPIVSLSGNADVDQDYEEYYFEYIDNHIYSGRSNFGSNSMSEKFGQVSIYQHNSGVKSKFNSDSGVGKAEYPFFESVAGDPYEVPSKIQTLEYKEGQDGPQNNIYSLGYSRFSEKVVMNLQKQMGKYGLDTRYVHLYINGKYRGLKTMRNDFKQNNVEEIFGGSDDDYTKVNLQDSYWTSGKVESGDGNSSDWSRVKNAADSKNFQTFKQYVDVEDFIKFMVMFMFTDTETEATAMLQSNPSIMKAKFVINDTDGAFFGGFGSPTSSSNMPAIAFPGLGGNYKYKWINSRSYEGPARMFSKFVDTKTSSTRTGGNLEFKTYVKDYVLESFGPLDRNYDVNNLPALSIENVKSVLQQNMQELDKLYKLDAAYMGWSSSTYNYWKNTDCPRILNQVQERVNFNLNEWNNWGLAHTLKPIVILSNSQVSLQNPNSGTVTYYTLDGSDPMGNNGVVSPTAIQYVGGNINAANSTLITARAFKVNNWGPKSQAEIFTTNQIPDIESVEQPADTFTVYPSPAKDKLFINLSKVEDGEKLLIVDMNGAIVYTQNIVQNKTEINLSALKQGIYLVQIIKWDKIIETKKFIKQ